MTKKVASVPDTREVREWLQNYEEDMFNIACQRCGSPFKDGQYAIAAPAEWYGVIEWLREAADEIDRLRGELESQSRIDDPAFYYRTDDTT